jgi:hypothetical protein
MLWSRLQPAFLLLMSAALSFVLLLAVFIRGEVSWNRAVQFSRGELIAGPKRAFIVRRHGR